MVFFPELESRRLPSIKSCVGSGFISEASFVQGDEIFPVHRDDIGLVARVSQSLFDQCFQVRVLDAVFSQLAGQSKLAEKIGNKVDGRMIGCRSAGTSSPSRPQRDPHSAVKSGTSSLRKSAFLRAGTTRWPAHDAARQIVESGWASE